ncbi:CotH kinase family protein [Sporosarcina sp. G11-34]|uniref:CotH kinase family protein n=1 Tax=Sporosarcina sp. G11-34 TaxID=2849605 RepID=UPI0022A9F43E|nr:CotH kinase family protein [Sporosarcina sp. G11-34]MCZ2260001.1 CotH kinase family protein [Sporosarcina sp. G11-34]
MSYLIPSYSLKIEDNNLKELRSDLWNNDPVPADLIVDGSKYDIDIAYRGSYTRKFRKRSYRIEFITPKFFSGVREIHLNAEYKDPSFIRNKLSFDFFHDLGVLSPESQHINLSRNDSHKGLYLQLESVDEFFLKKRGLPMGPIFYAVNNNANFSLIRDEKTKTSLLAGYQRAFGTDSDDDFLLDFINKINTIPLYSFQEEIANYINVDSFLRWLAVAVCTMNNDGFTHNYALYRNSETGLFEIIPWDYDATWGRKINGGIMPYNYVPMEGKKSNHLCYLLMRIPDFRKLYRSILEEILETKFTVDYMDSKINTLHEALRPHILLDPYKKKTIEIFNSEPDFICQFIQDRSSYLKHHLVNFA